MARFQWLFAALILAQAVHSIEEYTGELYQSFPPARFVSGLISSDHQRGFLIGNLAIVTLGVWCTLVPVARNWPSARVVAAAWAAVELVNGLGHLLWSAFQGEYSPGVATAPALLVLALLLTRDLGSAAALGSSTWRAGSHRHR